LDRRRIPVILIDAITVKIRDGQVANRPVYVAMGVNLDGERDVAGANDAAPSSLSGGWPNLSVELSLGSVLGAAALRGSPSHRCRQARAGSLETLTAGESPCTCPWRSDRAGCKRIDRCPAR
jgi:hypothetical protein